MKTRIYTTIDLAAENWRHARDAGDACVRAYMFISELERTFPVVAKLIDKQVRQQRKERGVEEDAEPLETY